MTFQKIEKVAKKEMKRHDEQCATLAFIISLYKSQKRPTIKMLIPMYCNVNHIASPTGTES
jgi:hypothetical protein